MDYLKSVFTKKQNKWLIFSGAALFVFFVLLIIGVALSRSLDSQLAAQRWSKDKEYAQVSVFFSQLSGMTTDNIKELDFKIEQKLDEDSLVADSPNGIRRISAYSAVGKADVASEKATKSLKAIGVGGDFFYFHPMELLSGSFFDEEDINKDRVVLDQDAAWELFGSNDIVGQIITVNGRSHVVAAVIKRDTGRLNRLAGNNESTIYLSYYSLITDMGELGLNSYEVLFQNPVRDYALNTVKDNITEDELRYEIKQNTGRFNWTKLILNVKNFGSRSMNSKTVVFPYWENMARGLEDIMTPICAVAVIMMAFVIVNLIVLLVRMYIKRTIHFKDFKDFAERRIEKYREVRNRKMEDGEYI